MQQIDDALRALAMDAYGVSTASSCSSNIPEFRLRAYSDDHQLALSMNVVVGKAAPTQTPVFTDDIRFIVFRPYWNVPPGILRRTVIPGIPRKAPGHLARERFEVTDSGGRAVSPNNDSRRATLGEILHTSETGPNQCAWADQVHVSRVGILSISTALRRPSCLPGRDETSVLVVFE